MDSNKLMILLMTSACIVFFIISSSLMISSKELLKDNNTMENELIRIKKAMNGSWCTLEILYSENFQREVETIICR